MAFTERYVTSAAGGLGAGTEGDPWTLAEGFSTAVAGDRVNILSDSGYSIGATTVTNVGTGPAQVVFRGYNSTIGDLEAPGRNASDGSLIITGFPAITLTGVLVPSVFSILQSLNFTGAVSGVLVGNTAVDAWSMVDCKVLNTQNNSSARAVTGDNRCRFINCDFECSGAAHATIFNPDVDTEVLFCRFKVTANDALSMPTGSIIGNLFIGDGSSVAINLESTTGHNLVLGNTIYNFGTAIQEPNSAQTSAIAVIANNHVTDCSKFIDNLHSATANHSYLEYANRTRDNTTPRTGVGDGLLVGEVTTDTGDDTTDFRDASAEDFRLIAGAPGKAAGLDLGSFLDIGAIQQRNAAQLVNGGLVS